MGRARALIRPDIPNARIHATSGGVAFEGALSRHRRNLRKEFLLNRRSTTGVPVS